MKIVMENTSGGICRYDEIENSTTLCISTKDLSVHSIQSFDENRLLLGTLSNGYLLFDKRSGLISNSFMDVFGEAKNKLMNDSVIIYKDSIGNYLVFNTEGKNFRYNPETKESTFFNLCSKEENCIQEKVIKVVGMDTYAIVSTREKIFRIEYSDLSSTCLHTSEGNYTSFDINNGGLVWIVDEDKLLYYDHSKQLTSLAFNTPNNGIIASLVVDNDNNIWLSSVKGEIYRYVHNINSYTIYSKEDNIPGGGCFLRNSGLCSSTGRLYFPSTLGMLVINTNELAIRRYVSRDVKIASIVVNGKTIPVPEDSRLVLPNDYKTFLMAMSFNNQDPTSVVLSRIIMEKNGKEVSSTVTSQPVFENVMLKSGNYTLKIQTLDFIGWSKPTTLLELKIKPPFLLSLPMLSIMFNLVIFIIGLIFHAKYNKKQRKIEQLLFEETTKTKELRIAFITNVAHELRTPLSLIINPLKDIMKKSKSKDDDFNKLERIFTQISKINTMVNMILDSSTRCDSSFQNNKEVIDINGWFSNVLIDFQEEGKKKGISVVLEPCSLDEISINVEVLELAINNVVSNALKYSDKGTITISIEQEANRLRVSVADQGRGFKCNPEELFVRFFRENNDVTGYGLGLPYTKSRLEAIGGSIKAEHNVDVGSVFIFEIPFDLVNYDEILSFIEKEDAQEEMEQSVSDSFKTQDKVLLFVDDDADMREFIKNEYKTFFKTILLEKDGKSALEKMKVSMPDIIVSDIMMPNINGFELCKTIKTTIEFSHLPIILLTSRADSPVKIMSFKLGADAFLPKPFDKDELYKLIKSQLWNRYEIKRQYSKSLFFSMSEEQTFSVADEQFILKLNKFIMNNLADHDLDVEMISSHMNVSRSTLFNKMNDLLETSVAKYIRKLRVETAKKMLESTEKSILDIALDCGFVNSQYLSAVFKQETNTTPSQYRKQFKDVQDDCSQ